METIIQQLEKQLANRSPEWRFPHAERDYSLRELDQWSRGCAERLRQLGVAAGTPVGLALNNGPVYVALLLGIWRLNAIAVPLRPHGGKGTGYAEYLFEADDVCDLHCLVHDADTVSGPFDEWAAATGKPAISGHQFTGLTADDDNYGTVTYDAEDIAVLQMTSGTTSRPRAVVVTHDMMMRQLAYLSSSGRLYAGDRVTSAASWLPLNHDMGLFTGVLWPIYDGSHNLLVTPAYFMRNPKRWIEQMSEARVTMNFATNTSAVAVCNAIERARRKPDVDLSGLHLYFGAEKLNADVLQRTIATLEPLGLDADHVHVGYGMAENALAATRTPPGRPRQLQVYFSAEQRVLPIFSDYSADNRDTLVSVGEPMPGYRIAILDPRGRELDELRVGEVHLSGPCLTPSYYRDPEKTREAFDSGMFCTGDLGFMHDGELYFIGRRDDVVNVGGRKIIPDDIEHCIERLELAVCGRTCLLGIERDDNSVTVPLLLVEIGARPDADAMPELAGRIRAAVLERHDLLIGEILLCEKGSIEMTSSGKKRRKIIRQRYLEGEIKGANPATSNEHLPRKLQA